MIEIPLTVMSNLPIKEEQRNFKVSSEMLDFESCFNPVHMGHIKLVQDKPQSLSVR